MVLHGMEIARQVVITIASDEIAIAALACGASGDLRSDVAQQVARLPAVLGQDREQGVVGAAFLVELEEGDAQALLQDFGRMHRGAAGRDAADIAMMRHRAGPADELA